LRHEEGDKDREVALREGGKRRAVGGDRTKKMDETNGVGTRIRLFKAREKTGTALGGGTAVRKGHSPGKGFSSPSAQDRIPAGLEHQGVGGAKKKVLNRKDNQGWSA